MKTRHIFLLLMLSVCLYAQSGFIKTPDQLYNSLDYKKPTGEELFNKQELPGRVDLSDKFPKPGYQGTLGSCAAWAVGYACKSFQEGLEHDRDPQKVDNQFSPSFIYNMVNKGENKGSTFPEVFNLIKDLGCATMTTMPYTNDYLLKPSTKAFQEAKQYKINNYKKLQNGPGLVPAIKSSLIKGQPVIVALKVYENFKKQKNEIYDKYSGQRTGGHGMCLIGYDDESKTFKMINSWGNKWGEGGYCRISYDLVDELFMEAYVCEDIVEKKVEKIIDMPKELKASEGAFEDHIDLVWQEVQGAKKYEVYRSNNNKEELEKIGFTSQRYFNDKEVLDKVKYIYSVKAMDEGQISGFSEVTCGWASREELGIPGDLKINMFGNAIVLYWSIVNRADNYNIYRMSEMEENYHLIGQSRDDSYTDANLPVDLTEDMSLYYLVTAQRADEESSHSNMACAKLFAPKSKGIIPEVKKNLSKKEVPEDSEDIIVPKKEQKKLAKPKKSVDFYDAGYMEKFFETARKAEQEALRKMKKEEEKYFDEFKKYEEEMYEKFK